VSETKHGPAGREDGGENARASLTLRAATDALRHESAMVAALADRLGPSFVRAVEMVRSCEGRVVVTGLGKSGLVGRKIAATLASTGTPAFFVHAAEAHHGDAGMVLPQDLLLAISNSGETDEVVAFARLAHARGSAVIAFASSSESSLGREADEFVDIGVQHEADPLDMTPTASTAATMAMGDALCIALMVLKGFGTEDFLQTHPGGAIGTRTSTLEDPKEGGTDHGQAGA
jgi:arabinose-5-phosphate isomerase